jgi:hypothetical protein
MEQNSRQTNAQFNYDEKLITKFLHEGVSLKIFKISIYKSTTTSDVSIRGCRP